MDTKKRYFERNRPIIEQDETPFPIIPTDYPPGSPGKLRVLRDRYRARVQLWHPDDSESRSTEAERRAYAFWRLLSSVNKALADGRGGVGHE